MHRGAEWIGIGVGIFMCVASVAACQPANSDSDAGPNDTIPDGSSPDGSSPDSSTKEDGPTGDPAKPFHAITGTQSDERVTGIYCPSSAGCVVSTANAEVPHLYKVDSTTATILFTSDEALSNIAGTAGAVDLLGFSKIGSTLIARVDKGGGAFVSATDDPLKAASWSAMSLGKSSEGFGLNAQYGFGVKGSTWIQVRNSYVLTASAAPGPSTQWTTVWSPGGVGQVPSNLDDLRDSDPTLCSSAVAYSEAPRPVQATYVAPDGSLLVYPASALNQESEDLPGVCISTDGGNRFHLAKLAIQNDLNGPKAVECTSNDHCVAAGGQTYVAGSAYVFVSNDASKGAASTWTAASLPSTVNETTVPSEIFFAPDGQHGWIVGYNNGPLLWSTSDGGMSWTDETESIAALTDWRLVSGFALDATHLVLGGENGTILTTL